MADTHIAAAPEVERFAAHRMAAAAAAKAKDARQNNVGFQARCAYRSCYGERWAVL